jgi:hypothetical protein
LEPSRTNLATQSEYFDPVFNEASGVSWQENATTSPEGVVNAAKLNNTNASFAGAYYVSMSFTNNDTMVASIFAKAGTISNIRFGITNQIESTHIYYQFNLTEGTYGNEDQTGFMTNYSADIEDYGNGWYRCIVVGTFPSSGVTSGGVYPRIEGNGYLYLYGLQVEKNVTYPTSYLPTYGTSATRTSESCSKTGISSLIGQTEGTLFVDAYFDGVNQALSRMGLFVRTTGSNTGYAFLNFYLGKLNCALRVGGVTMFDSLQTGLLPAGRYKIAMGYKSGDTAIYMNGNQVGTDTDTFGTTGYTEAYVGCSSSGVQLGDGINQALVFTSRLSNADLATLTSL